MRVKCPETPACKYLEEKHKKQREQQEQKPQSLMSVAYSRKRKKVRDYL